MTATNPRIRRTRSAFVLVYLTIVMVALLAFASLAVDYGRAQVAKTELLRAADAAARYAVTGLTDRTYLSKAMDAAGENLVDGTPLVLESNDVEIGNWDAAQNPPFSTTRTPVNAVRVTARRAAARGTAIPTIFAQVLGRAGCDVIATSIATAGKSTPNFVGLNGISAQNNVSAGYDPTLGLPGTGSLLNSVELASNGTVSFVKNATIDGGVILGPSGTFNGASPTPVRLTSNLAYPSTENPPAMPSGDLTVDGVTHVTGGGTLIYSSIVMGNNSTLIFDRPTTVYVIADVSFKGIGEIKPGSGLPADLKIRIIGSNSSVFGGSGANGVTVTGQIYAPNTDFSAKNNAELRGTALFRSIKAQNNLTLYYDVTSNSIIQNATGSLGNLGILTVK